MILYRDRETNKIAYIEVFFRSFNYQHLTGIELMDENSNIRKNVADLFYQKCITNTLRKDEICFKTDGTTSLKLMALPALINIHKITKITGDYNCTRTYLIADKLISNVNFCLGLKKIADSCYAPASALLENIKSLSRNQSQVLAIFSKQKTDTRYTTIRYVAKGINLKTIVLPENITNKISLDNYIPKNK